MLLTISLKCSILGMNAGRAIHCGVPLRPGDVRCVSSPVQPMAYCPFGTNLLPVQIMTYCQSDPLYSVKFWPKKHNISFFQGNSFENVVCNMLTILLRPWCIIVPMESCVNTFSYRIAWWIRNTELPSYVMYSCSVLAYSDTLIHYLRFVHLLQKLCAKIKTFQI